MSNFTFATPPNLRIREAGPDDANAIASLIMDLAHFEELEEEMRLSVENLRRDLDPSANPRLYCSIAEVSDRLAGYALYYLTYDITRTTWVVHLQNLFVHEEYRKQNIGRTLVEHLADSAETIGCEWIEFDVLDWNDDAIRFYERIGAAKDTQRLTRMCLKVS